MKQYTLLLLIFFPLIVVAQTQKGYVRTAGNLNQKGLPLSDVSIKVSGNFNPTKSDITGNFSITMPQFKNGTSSYVLQSVYKSGFELCDKDFLGRKYPFSTEVPLEIVMISKADLIKIQTKIEDNARSNAEKQYNTQIKKLKKELFDNKITAEQYRIELEKLRQQQESFYALITIMAERYARTDYDKLDSLNKAINIYITEGKTDKADSLINSKGNITERITELHSHKNTLKKAEEELQKSKEEVELQKAEAELVQESLAQDLLHKCTISLSELKIDTAAYFIKLRAELDPSNWNYQKDAGSFFRYFKADYQQATNYYQKALICAEKIYSKQSEQSATCYIYMGLVADSQGDFTSAKEYYLNALNIREKIFGKEHPNVANCYNNIALLFCSEGNYESAIEFNKKALNIREKVYGKEDADVAISYNNIGQVYKVQGDYTKAIEYYFKALNIWKKTLWEEHPYSAVSYSEIGDIYNLSGNYTIAMQLYIKALNINLKLFGTEHPNIAKLYRDLGTLHSKLGNYADAIEFCQKALNIQEKTYKIEHPEIAQSFNEIGLTYYSQGNYKFAIDYYKKALAINEKVFGFEHLAVATSYNNIGLTYSSLGDQVQAAEYLMKALHIREKKLGIEHLEVAETYNNLGMVSYGKMQYELALEYFKKAVEIFKNKLGNKHPDLAKYYSNIGSTYGSQKNYNSAIEYFKKALDISREMLGGEHPDVATYYFNIGSAYSELENNILALDYYKKALEIREKIFGVENSFTITSFTLVYITFTKITQTIDLHSLTQLKLKHEFENFMKQVVLVGNIIEGDLPAANKGLHGKYYICAFENWNLNSLDNLFEYNFKLLNKPKKIVLVKDNKILVHQFENIIGMKLGIERISKEKKIELTNLYSIWKNKTNQ